MNFTKYLLNKRPLVFLAVAIAGLSVAYFMPFGNLSAQAQTPVYADTLVNAWHYEYIGALQSRGVFEGTECDEGFCPNQPLPRWQMAVWLIRALEDDEPSDYDSRFADVEDNTWWTPYTERMADFKITVGCKSEPLSYCPERSVTRAQMAAFIYRGLQWKEAQAETSNPTQPQPEFITEENDLSRWAKRDLIDEYGDKWPWLKEVWDYTNREDFEYVAGQRNSFGFWILQPYETGDVFVQNESDEMTIYEESIGSPHYISVLAHELAHIYTYSYGAAANPASVAIGWLYFEAIAQDCADNELYVQAAEFIDDFEPSFAYYWRRCSHLPKTPTAEAITVVSQAFSGQMPDWFYDTFQKADGSLDYAKLWTAIKDSSPLTREIVVPGLRNVFSGYCSEQAIWDDMFAGEYWNRLSQIDQPWRDGGC